MTVLSIIIPVYNVEDYLFRCLNSIVNQSDERVQIILVDDGSTDNSISSIKSLLSKHSNIQLYSQKNSGLSSARNYGLSKANGQYVYFVDSDDYIADGVMFKILDRLQSSNDKCFAFNHTNTEKMQRNGLKNKRNSGFYFVNIIDYLKKHPNPITNVWKTIVLRELLIKHNIMFRNGVLCEDIEFLSKILMVTEKVVKSDMVLYVYNNQRPSSIMNMLSVKRITDTANNIKITKELISSISDSVKRKAFNKLLFIEWCVNLSFYSKLSNSDKEKVNIQDCFSGDNEVFIFRLYNILKRLITVKGLAKLFFFYKVFRKWVRSFI